MSISNQQKNNSNSSPSARGVRLKKLRELTGSSPGKPLTRAQIERKYGLSARTLKNWESGDGSGLSEKGARRIIDIYQKENIQCYKAWLLEGTGPAPQRISHPSQQHNSFSDTTNPLSTITKERQFFESLHPEGVTFEVKDDAMAPSYRSGDIVGGVRQYGQDISKLIDHDCIIETKSGEIWLRRLQLSTIPGQYNLYALNPSTKIERPTIYSVEIITAALVMRHWRGKKWAGD